MAHCVAGFAGAVVTPLQPPNLSALSSQHITVTVDDDTRNGGCSLGEDFGPQQRQRQPPKSKCVYSSSQLASPLYENSRDRERGRVLDVYTSGLELCLFPYSRAIWHHPSEATFSARLYPSQLKLVLDLPTPGDARLSSSSWLAYVPRWSTAAKDGHPSQY